MNLNHSIYLIWKRILQLIIHHNVLFHSNYGNAFIWIHILFFLGLFTMAKVTVKQDLDVGLKLSKDTQVLIVGKKKLIKQIKFDDNITAKFSGLVSSKIWDSLTNTLVNKGSATIPLHLNLASVCFSKYFIFFSFLDHKND